MEGEKGVELHDCAVVRVEHQSHSQVVSEENEHGNVDNVLRTRPKVGEDLQSTRAQQPYQPGYDNVPSRQVVTTVLDLLGTLRNKNNNKDGTDKKSKRVDKLVEHGVADVRVLCPDVTLGEHRTEI